MNAHTRFSRNLALIVLPGIGILLALSLYFKLPLELALALLAACGISLYVVSRLPEVLLLAVMFAPQWKTYWPLSLVDRAADLTLLSAVGLAVAIAWRLFEPGGTLEIGIFADSSFSSSEPSLPTWSSRW